MKWPGQPPRAADRDASRAGAKSRSAALGAPPQALPPAYSRPIEESTDSEAETEAAGESEAGAAGESVSAAGRAARAEEARSEAARARALGAPLLEGLEAQMPGAGARAEIAATLALAIATQAGADDPELIAAAARLGEVGKLYAEPELRWIPLGDADATVRPRLDAHFEYGRALAHGAGIPNRACAWILNARESWDGGGPTGLQAGDIPLGSRVIAVCREYLDAPQAPAVPGGEPRDPRVQGVQRLEALAGSVLDPALADIAIALAAPAAGITVQEGSGGPDEESELEALIAAAPGERPPAGDDLLLARDADGVAGALAYADAPAGEAGEASGIEIAGIWVREPRRGIGSALLEALAQRAGARERTALMATVGSDELAALGFLQSRGFRLRALRPGSGAAGAAGRDELELERVL